jgi:hypothetical protein
MNSADCEQSSCELPIVVVGVPPPNRTSYNLSDEIVSEFNIPQAAHEGRNGTELRSAVLENTRHDTPDLPMDSSGASASEQHTDTPETSGTEDIVRRSSVRVLRGILKKPRRHSREIKVQEIEETRLPRQRANGESASIDQSIIPEISSQHSDDDQSQPNRIESPTKPETNLATYKAQRGSLQMAAFDRVLFAKRGAELRDEYMRDGRNNGDLI